MCGFVARLVHTQTPGMCDLYSNIAVHTSAGSEVRKSGLADAKGAWHSRVCDDARESDHCSAAVREFRELVLLGIWRFEKHERVEAKVTGCAIGARHLHVVNLLSANSLKGADEQEEPASQACTRRGRVR